jgi:integrase
MELQLIAKDIPSILTKSIAPNTFKRYAQGYKTWTEWTRKFPEICTIPAEDLHLGLFIASVIQSNGRYGRITSVYYGLKWLHDSLRLRNPCDSMLVKTLREAAKRILSRSPVKKEPMSPYNLTKLATNLKTRPDLLNMRTLTMAILSYAGFFRYDEVSRIRRSDIIFEKLYIKIFIESSKGDQYRDGDWVYIARTNNRDTCPYTTLLDYLQMGHVKSSSDEFIFRGCTRRKTGLTLRGSKPISYTRTRETILSAIEAIGLNKTRYGLHSFRRGGATYSARAGVKDRLFKRHGRWKSENAKDGYISDSLEAKLSVSKNLGI